MKGAKDQDAQLRTGERQRYSGGVPHLSYQDNIGVFAACHHKGIAKALGMGPDFAMGEKALLVRVYKLQRIFDGDDVGIACFIDIIDQCREGC